SRTSVRCYGCRRATRTTTTTSRCCCTGTGRPPRRSASSRRLCGSIPSTRRRRKRWRRWRDPPRSEASALAVTRRRGFAGDLHLGLQRADQAIALVQPHADGVVARLPELVRLAPAPLVVRLLRFGERHAVRFLRRPRVVLPFPFEVGTVEV